MVVVPGRRSWLAALGLAVLVGCGSSAGDDGGAYGPERKDPAAPGETPTTTPPGAISGALRERPWEVISAKGETYLANVFYADASQNEQIMPWVVDGRAVIDRLVYPTLGNPNLYVKDDASDELTMVLRLEPNAFDHLQPKAGPSASGGPSDLALTQDAQNELAFFLVARGARVSSGESPSAQKAGSGVYKLIPKKIQQSDEPADMPAALKQRKTVRCPRPPHLHCASMWPKSSPGSLRIWTRSNGCWGAAARLASGSRF